MAEVKLYSAIINEAGEQAWAVLEADYARLSELKDTLVEALKAEFDGQNCICKFLGYTGEEPPCRTCKLGKLLSAAALFEQERGRG